MPVTARIGVNARAMATVRIGRIAIDRTVTGRIAASAVIASHATAHLVPNFSGTNSPGWISTAVNALSGMKGRRLRHERSVLKGLRLLRYGRNVPSVPSALRADVLRGVSRSGRNPTRRPDFRLS
jgi:hypothetical protein